MAVNRAEAESGETAAPRGISWRLAAVLILVIDLAAILELPYWIDPEARSDRLSRWLSGMHADVLPFAPWLLLLPVLWFGFPDRRTRPKMLSRFVGWLNRSPAASSTAEPEAGLGGRQRNPGLTGPPSPDNRDPVSKFDFGAAAASVVLAGLALLVSGWASASMRGLPPAYHDEYSYLFQAETFLDGRVSYPSFRPRPELFDQMHVLNEGRFASRYFPGVGLWIAPFLALGNPWLGHQVAFALVAGFVFQIGRELSNNGVGLLAGGLTALSPGIVLFSTTLLAHLPTLAALTLFAWTYLRGMRTASLPLMAIAGGALTFAMLCRPMTAAGFALPFGVHFACWWIAGGFRISRGRGFDSLSLRKRTVVAGCLGGPILAGLLGLAWYDNAITGSPWKTPYQLYTDIYTPRHVYGFNNVVRGERNLGPRVLENYDQWAENLTPQLALENVRRRLVSSLRFSLGILPVSAAVMLLLVFVRQGSAGWWLIPASIASQHALHVPYWFEGIMGWHYVFETAPLWLLLVADATRRLGGALARVKHRAVLWGWGGLLATAVAVNLTTIIPLWPGRLERGLAEMRYPRQRYAAFDQLLGETLGDRPAVVLIVPDPSDRHMDFVTNRPSLSGPILRARLEDRSAAEEVARLFPDRDAWLYDVRTRELILVRRGQTETPNG